MECCAFDVFCDLLFCNTGDGGALLIAGEEDAPANVGYCCYDSSSLYSPNCPNVAPPAEFRRWSFNSTVMISDSAFIGNAANTECKTCSGGAISVQPGGDVSIINCTIANNSAEFFGGGVFIGGSSPGYASCSLNVSGSVFIKNRNALSGTQLYSSCGGSVDFTGAQFQQLNSVSEVPRLCLLGDV